MDVVRWQSLGVAVLCALAVSGCDDRKKESAPQQTARMIDRAVQAAEDQIRAETKKPTLRYRGVMPWTQALPNRVAVCGQAAVFGEGSDVFVPFVSIVTYAADGSTAAARVEAEYLGSTTEGAGRVYLAMVDHCWEKGGPKTAAVQVAALRPPVPNDLPDPATRAASPPAAASPFTQPRASLSNGSGPVTPAAGGGTQGAGAAQGAAPPAPASQTPPSAEAASGNRPAADQAPASGDVTLRQNGNLRASPQGAVVRVVQQGTAMRVFAQAPGGWYQVGDTAPWGWIHNSMLDKR